LVNDHRKRSKAEDIFAGLSAESVWTSMEKVSSGGNDWLGDLASALVPPAKGATPGDCMGLSAVGISGLSCDMVSNFVCEAPKPKLFGDKGQELPFSDDLLKMAESMGIPYIFLLGSNLI
jgi:hypothetical protein